MNTKLSTEEIRELISYHARTLQYFEEVNMDVDYHTARLRKLALTYKLLTMTQTETK